MANRYTEFIKSSSSSRLDALVSKLLNKIKIARKRSISRGFLLPRTLLEAPKLELGAYSIGVYSDNNKN